MATYVTMLARTNPLTTTSRSVAPGEHVHREGGRDQQNGDLAAARVARGLGATDDKYDRRRQWAMIRTAVLTSSTRGTCRRRWPRGRVPGPTTAVVALITSAAIASHVVMPSLWRGRKLPVKQDHHGGRLSTPSGRRVL